MSEPHTFDFVMDDGRKIAGRRWKNLDGSPGGWVAENSEVHPTAIVEETAVVEPFAVVRAGEHIFGDKPGRTRPLKL